LTAANNLPVDTPPFPLNTTFKYNSGGENLGFDIYPQGDSKPFQATCDGKVDTVALDQSPAGYWRVNVFVHCNDYVYDPDDGGYFIPFFTKYTFETMSLRYIDGQDQLSKIRVAEGDSVGAGDIIGELKMVNSESHVEFGTFQFGGQAFSFVTEIPFCQEDHFSSAAKASMKNLLINDWPHTHFCY